MTRDPSTSPITAGEAVTFTADTDSADVFPATYTFYKNDVLLESSASPTYTIPSAELTDSGDVYTVTVTNTLTNKVSVLSNSVSLTVKPVKPTLTVSPTDPTDGDNVDLTCASTTAGITEYEFFDPNGASLGVQSNQYLSLGQAEIGNDDGMYTCTAISNSSVASDPSDEAEVACKFLTSSGTNSLKS